MSATVADDFNKVTLNERVQTVKNATLRVLGKAVSLEREAITALSTDVTTITKQADPWDDIFGRFDNDPSWADFPRWLNEQNRIDGPDHPQD